MWLENTFTGGNPFLGQDPVAWTTHCKTNSESIGTALEKSSSGDSHGALSEHRSTLGTAGRVQSQSYIGRNNQELLDFDARTSLVLRVHQVICSFVSQLCPSWHHHKQLGTTFGQSTVFTS
jgi:hypothetical protein